MKLLFLVLFFFIGSSLGDTCPSEVTEPVFKPHPTDCHRFYVCLPGGVTVPGYCGGDLLYDEDRKSCWPKDDVDCHGREPFSFINRLSAPLPNEIVYDEVENFIDMISSGNEDEGTENSHCPANSKPGQFQLVPHETDCDKFYMCMGPKETLKTCRPGQLFNPQKHRCDKAENVDCGQVTTVLPEFEDLNENEGHCPVDADPSRLVRVAHETDCDKYYMCYNNKEKVHTCKQGKLFSDARNHCLKADKVECGDRTTAGTEATPTTTPGEY
uniref:CSON003390 protein n=1 Tax=Culicoides sonorensis TaxID=179676 RepID=A0A336ML64_CULSO